jgi:class 3 adenylate cyclase
MLPVIMVTALDPAEERAKGLDAGADDFLTKPINRAELLARVKSLLRIKRLYETVEAQAAQLAELNKNLEHRVEDQLGQLDRLGRLKGFFSPQLAELIIAGGAEDPLQTHRREVTVVFLDLRGFTAFAETAEPEEVMSVLRVYHAEMGKLIIEHQGTLERFTGDGMMIFFNDPVPVPNPAERAIRMALDMRRKVVELIGQWRKFGYDLECGIGIAQGYATIGAIGFEGRWDYGAIGTVTNLASRLCSEAKPGQILVSQRLLGALEGLVDSEPVGGLQLKGFHRDITAYNILRLTGC